jgi:predicted DNA-binding protein (MmcQ/YjbR family)
MTAGKRSYNDGVPEYVERRLREICLALPEAREEHAWVGTRWKIRARTFAHVLGVDVPGSDPLIVLSFRSSGEELHVLSMTGHPFFVLGWGRDAMGMVLDDTTNWDEVRELVKESFCLLAPKKLRVLVGRTSALS